MITFLISIAILLLGYLFYSKFIDKIEGIDHNRVTPAFTHQDDVDYVPMPWWRIFLIQFLNIAGLGPIFGAVAGAALADPPRRAAHRAQRTRRRRDRLGPRQGDRSQ